MRGKLLLLLSFVLWMPVGCNSRHGKSFSDPAEMERYAALPLASATHDQALRAELAQIVAEKGTPVQLDAISRDSQPAASAISSDRIRAELIDVFPTDTRDRLVKRLATIYPDENFRFAPLIREAANDLLQFADNRQRSYQRLMLSDYLMPMHSH